MNEKLFKSLLVEKKKNVVGEKGCLQHLSVTLYAAWEAPIVLPALQT